MKMNSKQKILVGIVVALVIVLAGTATFMAFRNNTEDTGTLKVVASFYPLGYLAREIGGDQVSVNTLIPENTEVHTWEPKTSDIIACDRADVLLYNGAGLDHWFEDDILGTISTSDKIVVETTHDLQLIENHDEHENETGGDEHDHGLNDPHTWISPFNARQQAEMIFNALVAADPAHEADYTANWTLLEARLISLDQNYTSRLTNTTRNTIVVNHAAYGYLAYRYNFTMDGIIGLSADQQPSTQVITDLVSIMEEHNLTTIFVDPVYADAYAETVRNEVEDQTSRTIEILNLYLMTGTVNGMDYLAQMQANLDNLVTGLGTGGA